MKNLSSSDAPKKENYITERKLQLQLELISKVDAFARRGGHTEGCPMSHFSDCDCM